MIGSVIGLLLLLLASALFSGSETALFSLSGSDLRRLSSGPHRLGRIAADLMRRPRSLLLSVLIGNTLVNVLIFADSYVLFHGLSGTLGPLAEAIAGAVSLLMVIVVGEVIPKSLAVAWAPRVAPIVAAPMRLWRTVCWPARIVLDTLCVVPLTRLLGGSSPRPRRVEPEELRLLIETSRRGGAIDADETELLAQVVGLGQLRVTEVMIPRVDVRSYDVDGSPEGLRDLMRQTRLTKIPVYRGEPDQIVGLIYAKRLFLEPAASLTDLVQPVRFVPEQTRVAGLLGHFRRTRTQLAVVVNEYGGFVGLVTLEDVVEQIVGDLWDPDEVPPEPEVVAIDERTYELAGHLSIRDWQRVFELGAATDRIRTVAGLVLGRLGRPASPGDVVEIGPARLTVIRTRGRRIERLRLELSAEDAPTTSEQP